MNEIIISMLSLLSLVTISVFSFLLAKKIKFPYTLFLVLVGTILAIISKYTPITFLSHFQLTPELLFYVFLPTLLFEAGYNIKISDFLNSIRSIFSLAIWGLLISTIFIGVGLYLVLGVFGIDIPLTVGLLFGAIISATDPVAVIALFKEYSAPKRLTLIFEGESLFNDGTAVAMFLVILGIITEHNGIINTESLISGIGIFLSMLFLGIFFGGFLGILFSKLLEYTKNENLQITLSLVVAHITFLLSDLLYEEYGIYVSAIVATVSASLVVGNYGRYKLTPRVEEYINHFWEYFAFIANSLVFILLGFLLINIKIDSLSAILIITIAILITILARFVSVFGSLWILDFQKKEKRIEKSWKVLLSWGSLRGALAITMVLLMPDDLYLESWKLDISIKDFIMMLVVASIYFSLFVKGLSIGKIINGLKISKVGTYERMEYYFGKALMYFYLKKDFSVKLDNGDIKKTEYDLNSVKIDKKINKYKNKISKYELENKGFIKRTIVHYAIGIEKRVLSKLYSDDEITERGYKKYLHKLEQKSDIIDRDNEIKGFEEIVYHHFIDDIFRKIDKLFNKDNYLNNHDKYYYFRALKESSVQVIANLSLLKDNNIIFESNNLDEVISEYEKYLTMIDTKLSNLSKTDTSIVKDEDDYLKKKILHNEDEILDVLEKDGLIGDKIKNLLKKELREKKEMV